MIHSHCNDIVGSFAEMWVDSIGELSQPQIIYMYLLAVEIDRLVYPASATKA